MGPLGKLFGKKPKKETVEDAVKKMEKGRKLASSKGSIGAKIHCFLNKRPHIETLPEVRFKDPVLIGGQQPGALALEIQNTGGATMTISSVTIPANPSAQFSVQPGSPSVESLGSTVAQVKFTARKSGRQLGKMLIVSDAENNGSGKEVVLIGVGLEVNRIKPVLKLAAKLVWYSLKMEQTDPVRIELSYQQAHTQSAYPKGGTLSWDSTILAVYRDRACKKPAGSGSLQLTNAELKGPAELWVRGIQDARSTDLSLDLEDPNDPRFIIEPEAREPVEVKELKVVTPKLEAEYLVALLRRESDPWKDFPADSTYVEIWFEESMKSPHYPTDKHLTLKSDGHLWLSKSAKFTDAVAGELKVTAKETGGPDKRFKVWVWGQTAGAFKLKLELEESGLAEVKTNPPAELDFGVVTLELEVHQHDAAALDAISIDSDEDPIADYHQKLRDQRLPAQEAMTDDEKTAAATARLLHVQKSGNFGRARVLCKKLDASQWPAGTGDYQIVIRATGVSGAVEVFDAEWDGAKQATPKIKVSELKTADKEFWVEGTTATAKRGEARLDLGLDRGAGGLDKTAKCNGDWARFTVVEIKEVKFEVTTTAGKAVTWNSATKRFYVNADANARELKDAAGRTISVTATLTKEIPDVAVHFMLAGDKKLYTKAHWGNKLPDGFDPGKLDEDLKATDKTDREKLLHVSAETDAKGVAKTAALVLSNIGGETYRIGAYTSQDPHLAKYVDGHVVLGKRKPVLSDEIPIWRKVFIQISRNKDTAIPARTLTETAFGVDQAFVEIEEIDLKKFDKADIVGLVEHPRWQFEPGGATTKLICVGEHNKADFHGFFKAATAATSPKAHLIMCDAQWDPQLGTVQNFTLYARSGSVNYKNAAGNKYLGVFDPPLSGVLVPAGSSYWNWKSGGVKHLGWLTSADVAVEQARTHTSEVKVTLPATCEAGVCTGCAGGTNIAPTDAKPATLSLQLNAASGPWGGESGVSGSPHCLIVVKADPTAFNNAVAHEIAHLFSQVRADKDWNGVPDHPDQYVKRGGQGSHCKKGATQDATAVDQDGKKIYVNGTCLMFHKVVGNVLFCDNCKLDLRVRSMTELFM